MKILLAAAALSLGLLSSCSTMGCCGRCAAEGAGQETTAMAEQCVITGEPLDANSPRLAYRGTRIGFCCNMCVAEWNGMDDAARDAALARARARDGR